MPRQDFNVVVFLAPFLPIKPIMSPSSTVKLRQSIAIIVAEGNALHHCVGSYVERIAEEECIILFLRRCANECKPFYTIEVRRQEVVQVRGAGNCGMTPEVEAFVTAWKQRALCAPLPAAAA